VGSIERVTDEELVALARQGDTDAFDQLVSRHQGAVYRAALAALHVPEDAEEAAQDAFVRAWRSLKQFRGSSSFRTWMLKIAWNRALSHRRSIVSWLRRRVSLETGEGVSGRFGSDRRGASLDPPSPHDALSDVELERNVTRAIEALSPKLRDTLLLANGECEYDEIAQMLKIPVGTVKWRVSEARRKVRERLASLGYVDAR
jgi:RNA polymerase sigma-70 factor, ECF subfamily